MTDQGNQTGLITKTMEKVKREEAPPVQQETPSFQQETPPEWEGKKKTGKRKLLIAVPALLVLICAGAGYLFFLKPAGESPAEMPRRSISARKKPGKPPQKQEEGKEDAVQPTSDPSKQKEAAASTKNMPQAIDEQVVESKTASESSTEALPGKQEDLTQVDSEQVTPPQEKAQIFASQAEEPGIEGEYSVPENETQIFTETVSDEEEGTLPEEYIEDELLPTEESFSEGTTSSYSWEPIAEKKQAAVEVTEMSDSRAERYYKKGADYHRRGELDKAINSYKEALNFNPDHLPAHMNLATAYLQTKRFKEAEHELAYLYALRPKDLKVLYNFALLLYQTGQLVSAEAKLRKFLELSPFHLEANLLLASIYQERGGINMAIELYMRAYQVNSADPRVLYRLGRAWDMAGDPDEAIKYYQLFLNNHSEKENQTELTVRDRLNYLLSLKEGK